MIELYACGSLGQIITYATKQETTH